MAKGKMENVVATIKDGVLTVKVDLSKTLGPSKSGKTLLIGTTHGAVDVQGNQVSVNVYKYSE